VRFGYAGYVRDASVNNGSDTTTFGERNYTGAMAGLYHVRHRVYDPELGRWTRRDPIGYVDGMGLYQYVSGASISMKDPTGLDPGSGKVPQPPQVVFKNCPAAWSTDASLQAALDDISLYCGRSSQCPSGITVTCTNKCGKFDAGECTINVGQTCDETGNPIANSNRVQFAIHELRNIMQDCQLGDFGDSSCNEKIRREVDAYLYAGQCTNSPFPAAPGGCCDRACNSMLASTDCYDKGWFGGRSAQAHAECVLDCAKLVPLEPIVLPPKSSIGHISWN